MSVSSTERLNRQLQEVQSEEFEEWLKSTGSKKGGSIDSESFDRVGSEGDDHKIGTTEISRESSAASKRGQLRRSVESSYEDLGGLLEKISRVSEARKTLFQTGIKSPWKYSPASELEERKMTVSSLDHEIEMEARRFKNRMKTVNKGWDKFTTKQNALIEALGKLDTLIKDCKCKRDELNQTFITESVAGKQYSKTVNEYKCQLKILNDLMSKTEKRVDNHHMFEDLLREVKEQSGGEFKSIREVIDRAFILESIRRRLMDWERETQEEYRFSMQEMVRINDRSRKNIWKLSGTLTEACVKNGFIANQLKIVENELEMKKESKQKQNMVYGQLQHAVNNLHIELSRHLRLKPKIPASQPDEQLKSIEKLTDKLRAFSEDISKNAATRSDEVAIEVDTQALEKKRLRYKM
ncbi:unnamed protein product [Allacma fusca]|uniref:DUF4200 domain-containing protein n=1 Tax=Allacma fusca TaxID=39272 RepID=A0A8J2K1I0_9HEXA|nr:unnamed protein product [Allacma fusca]